MRRADKLTAGPIGVGTRFRSETTSMRRPLETMIEITAYDRPYRLGSSTHLSAMDIHSTLVLLSAGLLVASGVKPLRVSATDR